jgi:hypothetical protein
VRGGNAVPKALSVIEVGYASGSCLVADRGSDLAPAGDRWKGRKPKRWSSSPPDPEQ